MAQGKQQEIRIEDIPKDGTLELRIRYEFDGMLTSTTLKGYLDGITTIHKKTLKNDSNIGIKEIKIGSLEVLITETIDNIAPIAVATYAVVQEAAIKYMFDYVKDKCMFFLKPKKEIEEAVNINTISNGDCTNVQNIIGDNNTVNNYRIEAAMFSNDNVPIVGGAFDFNREQIRTMNERIGYTKELLKEGTSEFLEEIQLEVYKMSRATKGSTGDQFICSSLDLKPKKGLYSSVEIKQELLDADIDKLKMSFIADAIVKYNSFGVPLSYEIVKFHSLIEE